MITGIRWPCWARKFAIQNSSFDHSRFTLAILPTAGIRDADMFGAIKSCVNLRNVDYAYGHGLAVSSVQPNTRLHALFRLPYITSWINAGCLWTIRTGQIPGLHIHAHIEFWKLQFQSPGVIQFARSCSCSCVLEKVTLESKSGEWIGPIRYPKTIKQNLAHTPSV